MSKYRDMLMQEMSKRVCDILAKPEQTDADKFFLMAYEKRLKKYEAKPIITTLIGYAEEIIKFLKQEDSDGI